MKKLPQIIIAVLVIGAGIFLYQKSADKKAAPEIVKEKAAKVEDAKEVTPSGTAEEAEETAAPQEPEEPKDAAIKAALKDLVPAGAMAYFNFTDLNGVFKEHIEQSNFFAKFVALKVFDELRAEIEAFNKDSAFKISFDNTLKVFGKDLLMTIYYDETKAAPTVLLSTELDDSLSYIAKVLTFFTQTTVKNNQSTEVGKETYKGVDINYIKDKGKDEGAYYLILDRSAHLATDISLLKKIIDLSQGGDKKGALSGSPDFIAVEKRFRDTNFFSMVVDFNAINKIQESVQMKYSQQSSNIAKTFKGIESYDYMYADAVVSNGIDLLVGLNLKDDSGDYVKFYDKLHGDRTTGSFIKNIKNSLLAYGAYSGISVTEYYSFMMKELSKAVSPQSLSQQNMPDPAESFEKSFMDATSLSFKDDLLGQFGDEVFYGIGGFDTSTPVFPIPKVFIGFKLKDADTFQQVYDAMNESITAQIQPQGMSIKHEEYGGYKLASVPTPFGVLPGHGIVSGYYIIYIVPSSLKSLIDEINSDKKPFLDQDAQKIFSEYLYEDYHYFSYCDSKLLLQQIPDLFDRYSNILQGQMTSEQRRDFLKKYNEEILPVVETLKVFDRFMSTGYYDEAKKQFMFKLYYAMGDID